MTFDRHTHRLAAGTLIWLAALAAPAAADPPAKPFSAADVAFFEKDVLPVLKAHCLKCHGGEKVRGGLRLTSRDDVLKGGHGDDLFLFNGGGGSDLILDFEEGHDLVRIAKGINGLDVNSADDLASFVTQDGCNAVVDLGGDTITLVGVSAEDIQNDPSKFFQVV